MLRALDCLLRRGYPVRYTEQTPSVSGLGTTNVSLSSIIHGYN